MNPSLKWNSLTYGIKAGNWQQNSMRYVNVMSVRIFPLSAMVWKERQITADCTYQFQVKRFFGGFLKLFQHIFKYMTPYPWHILLHIKNSQISFSNSLLNLKLWLGECKWISSEFHCGLVPPFWKLFRHQ